MTSSVPMVVLRKLQGLMSPDEQLLMSQLVVKAKVEMREHKDLGGVQPQASQPGRNLRSMCSPTCLTDVGAGYA